MNSNSQQGLADPSKTVADLAWYALELADQDLEHKPKKTASKSQTLDSYISIEKLSHVNIFTSSLAEEAAEFLKRKALVTRATWLRLGVSSGTYIALFGVFSSYVLITSFGKPAATAALPLVVGIVIAFALFAIGTLFDHQQNSYSYAESYLKTAGKKSIVAPNSRTPMPVVQGPPPKFKKQDHQMLLFLVCAFLFPIVILLFGAY